MKRLPLALKFGSDVGSGLVQATSRAVFSQKPGCADDSLSTNLQVEGAQNQGKE